MAARPDLRSGLAVTGRDFLVLRTPVGIAINPLAAVLRVENGRLPESAAFPAAVEACEEAVAVARASGVELPQQGWHRQVEHICRATARNRCSMLVDLESGRRTEINELNGAVVATGERLGVDTPVNRTLVAIVRFLEEQAVEEQAR